MSLAGLKFLLEILLKKDGIIFSDSLIDFLSNYCEERSERKVNMPSNSFVFLDFQDLSIWCFSQLAQQLSIVRPLTVFYVQLTGNYANVPFTHFNQVSFAEKKKIVVVTVGTCSFTAPREKRSVVKKDHFT